MDQGAGEPLGVVSEGGAEAWSGACAELAWDSGSEATLYWKSRPELQAPDFLFCQVEFPVPSERTAALGVPEHGWTMFAGLAQPMSRGRLRLRSSDPLAPLEIDANMLSDPDDMVAAVRWARARGARGSPCGRWGRPPP